MTDNVISLATQKALRAAAKDIPRGVELIQELRGMAEVVIKLGAYFGVVPNALTDTAYAHVLNSGAEDLWPGDISMFYPELFACRMSDVDHLYVDTSHLAEHKRCETQRRCQPYPEQIPYFDYDFFRGLHSGSFPYDVVMSREEEIADDSMFPEDLNWELESPPPGRKP